MGGEEVECIHSEVGDTGLMGRRNQATFIGLDAERFV
jgi:hypothetical protein